MNCLIITFPNHEIYNYFKLIVDNFALIQSGIPGAPGASAAAPRGKYKGQTSGSLGVCAAAGEGPWSWKRDASSTENGRLPGVWEFGLDKRRAARPVRPGDLSTGYEQLRGSLGV